MSPQQVYAGAREAFPKTEPSWLSFCLAHQTLLRALTPPRFSAPRHPPPKNTRLSSKASPNAPPHPTPYLSLRRAARLEKLNTVIGAWADTSCEVVLSARNVIDDCMRVECFEMGVLVEISESDWGRFEDGEKVG